MTIDELNEYLLKEHKKDQKYDIINVIITTLLIVIVFGLLYYFAKDILFSVFDGLQKSFESLTKNKNISKLVMFIPVFGLGAYAFSKIYPSLKRKKRINLLIEKLNSGLIASSVEQSTVHKITIPLWKINIKLAPLEYVHIILDQDTQYKPFNLPFPIEIIPDLKLLLSGVNADDFNKAWDELYIENNSNTTENEKIKSVYEFKTYIDEELSFDIESLENERTTNKNMFIKYGIFSAIFIIAIYGAWFFFFKSGSLQKIEPMYLFYGFIGFSALLYVVTLLFRNKKPVAMNSTLGLKTKIIKPMINFINPSFQYILHGHLTLPEVLETGILEENRYSLSGNDQIIGSHNGVPFQFSDLELEYKRNFSSENDNPDAVFYGQAFIAKFNKSFNSEVYIYSRKKININLSNTLGINARKPKGTEMHNYKEKKGKKVILEDPEFMKLFDVYGTDQVDARYIVSPALMERIKDLNERTKGDLFLSFRNDRISILNNSKKNNFEAGMFKSLTKNENSLLTGFYKDFCDQVSIIDDLKLNIKIWNNN